MADPTPPPNGPTGPEEPGTPGGAPVNDLDIVDELQTATSPTPIVIVSRALPDVRDGLKPSQRRILVAMNDLGLGPTSATSKCAGIVGETMKRYHPHGDASHLRHARPHGPGLGDAATGSSTARATSAPSPACRPPPTGTPKPASRRVAAEMLADLDRDTVDFIDNYDGKYREPLVLPSQFPNLLVNGSDGIAVGMATRNPAAQPARGLHRRSSR